MNLVPVQLPSDQIMTYIYRDIHIRTFLKPGDIGYVIFLHGRLYEKEYGYGLSFEAYVAQGLYEFYKHYDPEKDRVWVCEHNNTMVGFLLLMHRPGNTAQLRYFIILPDYRGIGLGNRLMELYMEWLKERGYRSSYLWTTQELHRAALLYKRYGFTLTEQHDANEFGKTVVEQRYDLVLE
jgi:GNAT superfamily N-acetyltransferase